jgi:hypothetical protein
MEVVILKTIKGIQHIECKYTTIEEKISANKK